MKLGTKNCSLKRGKCLVHAVLNEKEARLLNGESEERGDGTQTERDESTSKPLPIDE